MSTNAPTKQPASPASDAAFTAAIFGRSKRGKTVAALRCFPRAHIFTASRGAAASWESMYPDLTGVLRVQETVVENLSALAKAIATTPPGAEIIVDDASEIAERHVVQLKSRGIDGYELWGQVRDAFLRSREQTMVRGRAALWTFHERGPETPEGSAEKDQGGPRLPSRSLTALVPHLVGTVGRVVLDPAVQPPLWKGALYVQPTDNDWITGDRFNATARLMPLSLREIIRQANRTTHPHFAVPERPKGLEWMDGAVDWLANAILSGLPPAQLPEVLKQLTPKASPSLRHWIHQDAAAQAAIKKAAQDRFSAYA